MSTKRGTRLRSRGFWITLGVLFVLSFLAIISSVEKGTVTGSATVPISYLKAGSPFHFEVKNIPGVKSATVYLTDNIRGGQITLSAIEQPRFNGAVLHAFRVAATEPSKLGRTEFLFKIREKDFVEKGVHPDDLRLFVNGNAVPVVEIRPEKVQEQGTGYVFYEAVLEGFREGQYILGRAAATAGEPQGEMPLPEPMGEEAQQEPEPVLRQPLPPKPGRWQQVKNFFATLFG